MMRNSVRKYFSRVRLGIMCGLIAGLTVMSGAAASAQPASSSALAGSTLAPKPPSDEFTTTKQYLTTFYPLWFTYNQSQISSRNRLVGPDRISHIYQAVVAINDDTLYGSTVLELAAQPVVLTIPETRVTYSILTLDQYGNVYDVGIPKETPGVFALTAPGFNDPLPPRVKQIPMPFDYNIMIFRADKYAPSGENLIVEAELFRSRLNMQPLCAYEGLDCPPGLPPGGDTLIVPELAYAIPFKTIADVLIKEDPIAFLRELQVAVASPETPPMSPDEQALSDHFDALFGTGDVGRKSDFAAGAQAAHQAILDNYLMNVGSTQWIHFTDMGAWGANVLNRASITEFIQYGNDISAAAYYHTFNDDRGKPLDGTSQKGYVLTFPPGALPEAKRFWSITAYTPRSIELVENPANKYLVARYTPGLEYNSDGSLTVYMTTELQPGVPPANWLPIPKGPFNIMLRVYGVVEGSSVADNTYIPPAVVKAQGGGK